MPPFKVPIAQKRVTRAPLPGVRLNVSASGTGGGEQARAITELGGAIIGVGEEIQRRTLVRQKAELEFQERKDKMNAQAGELEFQDKWNTEKLSFLGALRLEADGSTKRARDWFKKAESDVMSRAKTPREKELLKARLALEQTKILNKVSDHEVKQLLLAEQELNDSIYINAVQEAGSPDSNVVDRVDAELKAIDALNKKYEGFDEETKKKGIADGMSTYHESVINGKLAGDLEFAKKYFNDTKKAIRPKERLELKGVIREEDISQTGRKIADEVSFNNDDRTKWAGQVDNKTQDQEIRDEANKILNARKRDRDAHDKELKQRDLTDGLNNVFKANNLEDGIAKADNMKDPENRMKGRRVAESIFKRKTRDVETDINVYADVLDRINAGEFKSIADLGEFYPNLSTAHYNKAVSTLQSKLTADRTGNEQQGGFVKYTTAKTAYETIKGEKRDVTDETQNKEFIFVQSQLDKHAQILGRDLTPTEANDLAAKYIVTGEEIGGGIFSDPDITFSEAVSQGVVGVWLPDLIDDEEKQIMEEIKAVNQRLPNDQKIPLNENEYRKWKKYSPDWMNIPLEQ
jgi:hypothetical protein